MSATNGTIEQLTRPRRTAAYAPHVWTGSRLGMTLDGRPRFTWLEVERMRFDPQVQFALRILRAPLFGVTWKVHADSDKVGRWVDREVGRVYRALLPKLLRHFEYGVACGEVTYQVRRLPGGKTRVHFHDFGEFHPRDCRPLVYNRGVRGGRLAGMRVNNVQSSGAGSVILDRRHAFWFRGESEYGDWWGRPRLAGAYEPWLEKRGRHGAIDSRRLFYKKGAFRGPTMRHPPGSTDMGTEEVPRLVSNQDIAREIVEKFENGGVMALPGARNQAGNFLWEWEDPKSFSDVAGLLDYPKQLDREILIGVGIPPELVDAATVGSGYSGRAIPAQVFFCSMDEAAGLILAAIVEQIVKPLARINFGRVGFEVVPDSLAQLVARDPSAAGQQPGGAGGQPPADAGGKPKVRLSLTARKKRRAERDVAWAAAGEQTREDAREAAREVAREAVREMRAATTPPAAVGLSLGVNSRAARRMWENCTGPVYAAVESVRLSQSTRSGPPGPPPHPGLEWHEETHRWRNPTTGEEHEHTSDGIELYRKAYADIDSLTPAEKKNLSLHVPELKTDTLKTFAQKQGIKAPNRQALVAAVLSRLAGAEVEAPPVAEPAPKPAVVKPARQPKAAPTDVPAATSPGIAGVMGEWQSATGRAKEYLAAALGNLGALDANDRPTDRDEHSTDERKIARRVGSVWVQAHEDGLTPEEMAPLERALSHVGVEARHEKGETVAFDGRYHVGPAGSFTGDRARIKRPALVHEQSDGREVVLAKAETERVRMSLGGSGSGGRHAPKGGITIGGTLYPGGRFIPGDVVASATPEEKAHLDSRPADPDHEADPERAETLAGLEETVTTAHPELVKNRRFMVRLGDRVLAAIDRMQEFMYRHHETFQTIGSVLAAVTDLPSDMKKLGYNPTTTSGTAGPMVHDPVKMAGLPVSGHVAISVAGYVVVKAYDWVKSKLSGRKSLELSIGGLPDVAGMFSELNAELLADSGGDSLQMSWVQYKGKRGGTGWKNDATGEVRYQKERPADEPTGSQAPARTTKGSPAGETQTTASAPAVKKRTQPDPPPPRFNLSGTGQQLVDADVQRWCEGSNEPAVAKAVGGKALPDNEPMDVAIPPPPDEPVHGIELKTMVFNSHGQIHMNADAKRRKRSWRRKHGVPVHTVVIDDRQVYNAGGPGKHDLSKRRVYYRRGFGSFTVDRMHEVQGGFAGLPALLETPTRRLPAGAWKPKPLPKKVVDRRQLGDVPATAPATTPTAGTTTEVAPEHREIADKWVASSRVSDEAKKTYASHMATVLSQMTPGCRKAVIESIGAGSANFHPDIATVTAECAKASGRKEKNVAGFVAHRLGDDRAHLHVDGDAGTGADETAQGIYAHELGHAVDVGKRFSTDPKWESAWKREIFNGKTLLSTYARESAVEGFAELHRHLVQKGVAETNNKYPKCVAYLKSKGLL